jgi:phosphoserine phosphatase
MYPTPNSNLVIVDLDGTLYYCNTFHRWILFLTRLYLKLFSFKDLLLLVYFSFLRFLRIDNHSKFKLNLIRLSQELSDHEVKIFVDSLDDCLNSNLLQKINDIKKEGNSPNIILCTAAPEFYVKHIASKFQFASFLPTPNFSESSHWYDNIGSQKISSLSLLLGYKVSSVDILYTDHSDDIPLMKMSKNIYLVRPTKSSILAINDAGLSIYTVLF